MGAATHVRIPYVHLIARTLPPDLGLAPRAYRAGRQIAVLCRVPLGSNTGKTSEKIGFARIRQVTRAVRTTGPLRPVIARSLPSVFVILRTLPPDFSRHATQDIGWTKASVLGGVPLRSNLGTDGSQIVESDKELLPFANRTALTSLTIPDRRSPLVSVSNTTLPPHWFVESSGDHLWSQLAILRGVPLSSQVGGQRC